MLRRKGCVRVKNGPCWVNIYQNRNKGFVFPCPYPNYLEVDVDTGWKKQNHAYLGGWVSRKKVWNNNNFVIAWLSPYCFMPGTSFTILLHFMLKVLCGLTFSCVLSVKKISGDLMQTCALPFAYVKYTAVSMLFINYLSLLTVFLRILFFYLWCLLWYA